MSFETERKLIETRWQRAFPSLPTQFDGVVFQVPKGEPWARLSIQNGDALQISSGSPGSNTFRHPGVLFVNLYVPAGQGTSALRQLGDDVCRLFRALRVSNIFFQTPTFRMLPADAVWQPGLVTAPFYRDELF